ncbi:response regulator [Rhizobium sp. NRK18]|uniref:response regulator n=1 Tax=Rhizobium sp. NRK18 TaxID=2964667 RepID=UPI0021C46891|nr:response regulator [Rhizobium sp. NRK18]MCQ2006415.1 response regulator [Rhizobium sp. NRK18]
MAEYALGQVLLIDDSSADNFLAKRVLKAAGIASKVTSFLSGDEALVHLSQAGREPVDLILLDVNMPRMDGFDFAAEYRHLDDALKARNLFLMVSSELSMGDERRLKSEPAIDAVIAKPLDPEGIARLLGLQRP